MELGPDDEALRVMDREIRVSMAIRAADVAWPQDILESWTASLEEVTFDRGLEPAGRSTVGECSFTRIHHLDDAGMFLDRMDEHSAYLEGIGGALIDPVEGEVDVDLRELRTSLIVIDELPLALDGSITSALVLGVARIFDDSLVVIRPMDVAGGVAVGDGFQVDEVRLRALNKQLSAIGFEPLQHGVSVLRRSGQF